MPSREGLFSVKPPHSASLAELTVGRTRRQLSMIGMNPDGNESLVLDAGYTGSLRHESWVVVSNLPLVRMLVRGSFSFDGDL